MTRRTVMASVGGAALLVSIAAVIVRGTTDPMIREREEAAELYQVRCALCHELEGGIGAPLDPRVLAAYGTAQLLFNYVRLAMPYDAPRTLSDEQYWLTVGHLLRSRGFVAEDRVVNAQTAEGISLGAETR